MPRPRKLNNPKAIIVYIEYEDYLALREIAFNEGKSFGDVIREAISEYLKQKLVMSVPQIPQSGGLVTPVQLRKRLQYFEFKELVKKCEALYERLKRMRKNEIYYTPTLDNLKATLRKAIDLASKLPSPPQTQLKKLLNIMNELGIE